MQYHCFQMLTAFSEYWALAQEGIWYRGILAQTVSSDVYTEEIIVRKCNAETLLEAEPKSLDRHSTDQKSGLWASVDKSNVVI